MPTRLSKSGIASLLALLLGAAVSAAPGPDKVTLPFTPGPAPGVKAAPLPAPAGFQADSTKPQTAPKSKLPCPTGALVWLDEAGTPLGTVPGVPLGAVRKMQVLLYRPQGDSLKLDDVVKLYVDREVLRSDSTVALQPQGAVDSLGYRWESRVLPIPAPDQTLVIGQMVRVQTGQRFGYSVLVTGKLNSPQALLVATSYVENERDKLIRVNNLTPRPRGSRPGAPGLNMTRQDLIQQLPFFRQNPNASPRVRELAGVILPQAASARLEMFVTVTPVTDQQLIDFYVQQGVRQGWGAPLLKDETKPGSPALLFNRPLGDGLIMIRADTFSDAPPIARRPANIWVLTLEGRFDLSALRMK